MKVDVIEQSDYRDDGVITVKIRDITTLPLRFPLGKVGQPWRDGFPNGVPGLLLEVHTDDGPSGACIGQFDPALAIVPKQVETYLKPTLIGEDPLRTDYLWGKMFNRFRSVDWKYGAMFAISMVDIALWDIRGKTAGFPVYKLLGGYRDKVPVYASWGLGRTPVDELLAAYEPWIEKGITAVKLAIGDLPFKEDLRRVAQVRKALGDNIKVLVDAQARYTRKEAAECIHQLEDIGVYWVEEPVDLFDVKGLQYLSQQFTTRVAAGENVGTQHGFAEILSTRAVDVIQPDAFRVGGITACQRIIGACELWDVSFSPHVFKEVSMHLVAASSKGLFVEYLGLQRAIIEEVVDNFPQPEEGCMTLPDAPGLGLCINKEKVKRFTC